MINPFLTQSSLQEVLKGVASLVSRHRPMWPWFSLKIAAAKWEGTWQILYLGVAGQFVEPPADEAFRTQYLLTATLSLPRDDLWSFLTHLCLKGEAPLRDWSFHLSKEQQSTDCALWSEGGAAVPPGIRNVAARADRSVACITATANWPRPSNTFDQYVAMVKADLAQATNYPGEIEQFISRQVGFSVNLRTCRVEFHFPIGLVVDREPSPQEGGSQAFRIRASLPLTPEALCLEYSFDMRYRNELPSVPLQDVTEEGFGWWNGRFELPIRHGMLLIRHPLLDRPLPYEYPEDPVPQQLMDLVAYCYDPRRPERGRSRWLDALRAGSGGPLEVALHNALTRIGWPAFFTGDLSNKPESNKSESDKDGSEKTVSQRADSPPEGVYPQTQGFDLAVLDVSRKRLMLVSIKGTGINKLSSMQWEVAKLNEVLTRVRNMMHGWRVYGRLVCNKISEGRLEVLPSLEGVLYSGEEWVERVLTVADVAAAEYLVWPLESGFGVFGHPL